MSPTDDLCYLSASTLASRIRARKLSPVDVIDALADRIKRLNPAASGDSLPPSGRGVKENTSLERSLSGASGFSGM
jgi:hypothetical protein